MKLFEEYIRNSEKIFDLDAISIEDLDKAYVDYAEFYDPSSPYDMIEEDGEYSIKEEKLKSSDTPVAAERVIDELKRNLNFSLFQFKVKEPNGVKFIEAKHELKHIPSYSILDMALLVPSFEENEEIIQELLDARGYYLSRKYKQTDRKNREWVVTVFDPKKQESIREMITNCYRYAYHTSPAFNEKSIDENGLVAKQSSYPFETNSKRVFLHLGMTSNEEYKNMMQSISRNIKAQDKNFNGEFIEYEIELDKIPEDASFYADAHGFGKEYIYIETNVPVNAITKKKKLKY